VFCDRRTDVDSLMRQLERMPFSVKALHGGYDQASRFRVMSAFRTGEVKALVATDVASRGLDVLHVTPRRQLLRAAGRAGLHAPHRPHGPRR
jgi:ATP-dependent RNA helicase DeaD